MTTAIVPTHNNNDNVVIATKNRPSDINELEKYIFDETGIRINYCLSGHDNTDYVSEFFGGREQYQPSIFLIPTPTPQQQQQQQQTQLPEPTKTDPIPPSQSCTVLLPPTQSLPTNSGHQWLFETIDNNLKWSKKLLSSILPRNSCNCIVYKPQPTLSKSQYKTFYNVRSSNSNSNSSRIYLPVLIKLWSEYYQSPSLPTISELIDPNVRWQHLDDETPLVDILSFKDPNGICINPQHWIPILIKEEKEEECSKTSTPEWPQKSVKDKKCIIDEIKKEVEIGPITTTTTASASIKQEVKVSLIPPSTEEEIDWVSRYLSSSEPSLVAKERSEKYLSDHPCKDAALVKTLIPPAEFVNVDPLKSIEMRNQMASKLHQSQYNNSEHLVQNLPPVIRGLITMSENTYNSLAQRGREQESKLEPSILRRLLKKRKKRVVERLLSIRLDYARKNLPRSGQFAQLGSMARPIEFLEPPTTSEKSEKEQVDLLNLQIGWSSHSDDGCIQIMDVLDQDADDIDILGDEGTKGYTHLPSHYSVSPLVALDQSRKPAIKLPVPCFFNDTDWATRYPLGPFENYEKVVIQQLEKQLID
jgi:hypothetical protein